jgi:DNA-binding NtrC family response regulator
MDKEKTLHDSLPGVGKSIRQVRRELLGACSRDVPMVLAGEKGTGKDHVALVLHRLTLGEKARFHRIDLAQGVPVFDEKCGDGRETWYLDHAETPSRKVRASVERIITDRPRGVRLILSLAVPPGDDWRGPDIPSFLRSGTVCIALPPLRERREDIPLLAADLGRRKGHASALMSPADFELIALHPWPGNVRELAEWLGSRAESASPAPPGDCASLAAVLDREVDEWVEAMLHGTPPPTDLLGKFASAVEKRVIRSVLARTGGNGVETAKILGINRNTLARKIAEHGLATVGRQRASRKTSPGN